MTTAERVLSIAVAELGVQESPAHSNRVKYNTWYYGQAVSGSAYPWCVVFVQWCFYKAGVLDLLPARTASCGHLMGAAKSAGLWVTEDFQPGDVVFYDFSRKKGNPEHCGLVDSVTGSGVISIEGNTSRSVSQSNGGEVCRKTRRNALIVGAVRPRYQEKEVPKMDNTPSPAHKEAVEWAVENGILTGDASGNLMLSQPVTRQQACTMLYRLARVLAGGPVPPKD